MTRRIPDGARAWTRNESLELSEVIAMYDDGFAGVVPDPDEWNKMLDTIVALGGEPEGEQIATAVPGFADSGKGKLSIPFVYAMIHFPNCLPGVGQEVGDCVSHSGKNADMFSYGCELHLGKPDPVTGKLEGPPENVTERGKKQGWFSTVTRYWYRGSRSHGWFCPAEATISSTKAGLIPIRDYTDEPLGMDLHYSGRLASAYGASPPPPNVAEFLDDNLVRQITTTNSMEAARDFISNGYCLTTCGSEGFESNRDEFGVARRTKTWHHAMSNAAFDDRPWTYERYDGPLILVQNSWSFWNDGPRDIHDSKQFVQPLSMATGKSVAELIHLGIVNATTGAIMIPPGSFWCRWKDWDRRTMIAKAGIDGFKRRELLLNPLWTDLI